jgi:DNA-directed RNA polymerase specialized sigma24 family protein
MPDAAAIESAGRYAGRSSVRTWLSGILKHKITDLFRNTHIQMPGRCVFPFAAGT